MNRSPCERIIADADAQKLEQRSMEAARYQQHLFLFDAWLKNNSLTDATSAMYVNPNRIYIAYVIICDVGVLLRRDEISRSHIHTMNTWPYSTINLAERIKQAKEWRAYEAKRNKKWYRRKRHDLVGAGTPPPNWVSEETRVY